MAAASVLAGVPTLWERVSILLCNCLVFVFALYVPTFWERVGILLSICKTGPGDDHHRNIQMTKRDYQVECPFFERGSDLIYFFYFFFL